MDATPSHLRAGIVGAGIMGRSHATMLASHPAVTVTAVASRQRESSSALAAAVGGAHVHDDWPSLVESDEVDLVVVATPDHLHTEVAVGAAQAGKHVLIEKPLATSVPDADRVLAAVGAARVKAMTLFNHRWVPAYAQAQVRVAAGEVGRPVLAYARKNDRIEVPTTMLRWASDSSPAWFLSSHDIDLVTWMMGDAPTEVFATQVRGTLQARGVDTADAMHLQVRYGRAGVATYEACWIYPDTFPTMTDSFVELVGTGGVIHLDRKAEQLEIATEQRFEYPRNTLQRTVHGVPAGAVRDCLWHFVDCVLSDRQPLVTLESSWTVTAVLEAAHESALTGVPVQVRVREGV